MPVFDGERFLPAALDSILSQSFVDFELIVSDNASTDSTEEICRSYASSDSRIRYTRSPSNKGAAWNFNQVFIESRSAYFRWAAADDLLAPRSLELTMAAMADAPATVSLVYPRATIINAEGAPMRNQDDNLDTRSAAPHERLHHVVANVVQGNPMFGIVRRKALAQTRLHGSYPSADWVLLSELALIGAIHELPDRLFLRRWHDGMSRIAHERSADLTAWLDPEATQVQHEYRRLLLEFLGGIRHAPLSSGERARCYVASRARGAGATHGRHARCSACATSTEPPTSAQPSAKNQGSASRSSAGGVSSHSRRGRSLSLSATILGLARSHRERSERSPTSESRSAVHSA